MAENKDIFGIGDEPVRTEVKDEGRSSDALSFFGVTKEEKKEE